MSSPHLTQTNSVSEIMLKVLLALVPAIAANVWFFGPAVLVTLSLASVTALVLETVMLKLRGRPVVPFLMDGSALLTAWLLALSIPPMGPWWLIVTGTAFAIVIAKHLYGGLGSNPFNPAMVGYAVLIISFPVQMTQWLAPASIALSHIDFAAQLDYMFFHVLPQGMQLDALTSATPLDTLKTQLHLDKPISAILSLPIYGEVGGKGGEWVAGAYLAGGLYLLQQRIISWHVPAAFIAAICLTAGAFHLFDPAHHASPWLHLAAGATMIGAFFILTDPVTGPTTPKGKLIFAFGAGFLTYLIRVYGSYPDGAAFAVLLMNICVPLIDAYTQPPVFGKKK
ncbi:MAG: electron transport complex subunit RsxD [Burkholderiales bacterium]|nr:electron transport complex subunit RsxD [Burkholderiales bacterium]